MGDSYVLYASKCRAELEEESGGVDCDESCGNRALRMTLVRERKRRISGRERPQTRSAVSRMVCTQVLLLRKGKGDRAEPRPDGALRLGNLLLPERHARLVVLILSVWDAVARMRLGHRSASGETKANGLSAFRAPPTRPGCARPAARSRAPGRPG